MRATAEKPGTGEDLERVIAGVWAFTMIGTDEAWAAVDEVCSDGDRFRRTDAMHALGKCSGPRVVKVLLARLDDPEQGVREAAYGALLRVEPWLAGKGGAQWSAENAKKMRELVTAPKNAP